MGIHFEKPIRLNIGAGNKTIEGFLNVGLEDHHDIKADVRDLSIIESDSVEESMAIHVLEHICRWEAESTLREWFRVLTPGGKLAIEMPELVRCARAVIENHPDRQSQQGLFGDARGPDLMSHRWCYSEPEIAALLREVGFIKIKFVNPLFHGKRRWRDMRVESIKPMEFIE